MIAEVIINSIAKDLNKEFHYIIPEEMEEKAKIDCQNVENEVQPYICTDRLFLTSKAYIEELYSKKMEKVEKNSYPESVKIKLQEIYESFNTAYTENCGEGADYDTCLNSILSYENIFKY